jgi:hypothetical protein
MLNVHRQYGMESIVPSSVEHAYGTQKHCKNMVLIIANYKQAKIDQPNSK